MITNMYPRIIKVMWLLLTLLAMIIVSGCGGAPASPEPTLTILIPATDTALPPTPSPLPPTNTPLPPTPTDIPTQTEPPPPTETPLPTETYTPTSPPPTASGDEAIYVYYIQTGTGGPVACGDSLIKVNTGLYRTGDVAADVRTALGRLFNKQEYLGNLYNPIFRSNFNTQSVDFKAYEGLVDVFLDGAYVRSDDRCDDGRVRAQIWTTIRQFPGVKTVYILLNDNLLGDILARDS